MKNFNFNSFISGLWIGLFLFLAVLAIQGNFQKVEAEPVMEKSEKTEVKTECPTTQNSFTDSVYLVSEKEIRRLPFCALNWDNQTGKEFNSDFCYDTAGWDGHDGVSIINLNE